MALPAKGNLDGSTPGHNTAMFQAAIGELRDYLAGLLGAVGTRAEAWKTLGVAVVDRAYAELVGYNSLTPTIPYESQPQSTQGTQILAAALTPKQASNRIRVKVCVPWSCADTVPGRTGCAAVFINGEAAAKFCAYEVLPFDGFAGILTLEREFVAGTTAPIAVTVRVGCNVGNFLLFGNRFSQIGGGSQAATLILEEVTA